jgi:hypothetical protein
MKSIAITILLAGIVVGGCGVAADPEPEGSADGTEATNAPEAEDVTEEEEVGATNQSNGSSTDVPDFSIPWEGSVDSEEQRASVATSVMCYTAHTYGSNQGNACDNAYKLARDACSLNGYTHLLPPSNCTGTCYPWVGCNVSVTVCCY